MDAPVRAHAEGAEVTVWVVPGARRTAVVGRHGDAVKVRVAEPPEAGRANRAVAALLAAATGADRVELLSGGTARRKRYLLAGKGPADVEAALGI